MTIFHSSWPSISIIVFFSPYFCVNSSNDTLPLKFLFKIFPSMLPSEDCSIKNDWLLKYTIGAAKDNFVVNGGLRGQVIKIG